MGTATSGTDIAAVLRRAAHPPVREFRFWLIQLTVLVVAGLHIGVDLGFANDAGAFPSGIPVALLIIPVGYAALRYGLAGAAATAAWAVLLWIPDLFLPGDNGHAGGDLIELGLVVVVAIVFGQRIEMERLAHTRIERATAAATMLEERYRKLFEANLAPILVLDGGGRVTDANPAAVGVLGDHVLGSAATELLGDDRPLGELGGQVVALPDGRDYRLRLVSVPGSGDESLVQIVLEDVTDERDVGRRATRYAQMVVDAEEQQRRRLARELHDEPLQLFLHLARRLERLADAEGVPGPVAEGLELARSQALDAAARLRSLARDLRPPALDQLGLVPAISSFVADIGEEGTVQASYTVSGDIVRLQPDVELGIFRIVQEAVQNTVRHAAAHRLDVSVDFRESDVSVRVTDDGRGFNGRPPDAEGSAHLGLLGMGERTRLLGGRLEIRSEPGAGTSVEAVFPRDPPRSVDDPV